MYQGIISGPASVAGTATGDGRRVARTPESRAPGEPPRLPPPGRPPEAIFLGTYAVINARKSSSKVRLNASRTSKSLYHAFGMSWRRNELITLTPKVRISSYSSSSAQQRRTDGRRHTRETTETGACDYTGRSWKGRRNEKGG